MPTLSAPAACVMDATLKEMSINLGGLLVACGVDDPANSPMVRHLVHHWTETMNGKSILDALALLFIGAVAVRGEIQKAAMEESLNGTPPMAPVMAAN